MTLWDKGKVKLGSQSADQGLQQHCPQLGMGMDLGTNTGFGCAGDLHPSSIFQAGADGPGLS